MRENMNIINESRDIMKKSRLTKSASTKEKKNIENKERMEMLRRMQSPEKNPENSLHINIRMVAKRILETNVEKEKSLKDFRERIMKTRGSASLNTKKERKYKNKIRMRERRRLKRIKELKRAEVVLLNNKSSHVNKEVSRMN